MVDRIAQPWGNRTPFKAGDTWPSRVDLYLEDDINEDEVDNWVPTASILHSNGDGMEIAVKDGQIVGVRGREGDRVNHGRVDVKDLYGWQANRSSDRLTTPLIRKNGKLVETDWDTAMERVANRTKELLQEKGPSSLGFYTSGQLFAEEYYALAMIARGGLGTKHLDGNTRLCTATAAASLKESFGIDGQPGSYADVDHADVIALYGHNVAETQSVLWMRILDRLAGENPPQIICVDPRPTPVARAATVHLAPLPGTNVAVMNAILHEIFANGWIDERYVAEHAVGFAELQELVVGYPPEVAARISGVEASEIERAARIIGTAERLLSTVLQGFYQSHQATAAAVQVNNIHIIRGMLGKPGCGVLQMNGQPTAQNARECGADGDMPGFRNWNNPDHIAELAELWKVDQLHLQTASAPTHAMNIMAYAEQGSVNFLWVSATNPAVSMPELGRIRSILAKDELFLVVQDIFLTETAQLADVVLPAATWGEKTGTFTNADRTVHLSEKAVEPPGAARSDLDIFLDYAQRLDLRNRDGESLIPFTTPEEAFAAWQECSRGRPCDYTGMSYAQLRAGGVQWPCTEAAPDGTERLYSDGKFWADPDYCESYGKDLITGASFSAVQYRAMNPNGKAVIRAAEYLPAHESPSHEFPFALITGRTIYQFHTRTKTGRARQLQRAAPDVWVEVSQEDAQVCGIEEGTLVAIETPRGTVEARARISHIRTGVLFLPFHYGYWDIDEASAQFGKRAANEVTVTDWDPVSKQPIFKTAAAKMSILSTSSGPAAAPTNTGSAPVNPDVPATRGQDGSEATERITPIGAER